VRALDLAGPYAQATARAQQDWDVWHELARVHGPGDPFRALLRQSGSFEQARDTYRDQAIVEAFVRNAADTRLEFIAGVERDPVVELTRDREDFVRRRVAVEARHGAC
jgi:hypothetical protein